MTAQAHNAEQVGCCVYKPHANLLVRYFEEELGVKVRTVSAEKVSKKSAKTARKVKGWERKPTRRKSK